jgi:transcriptional regulator with XRE-family HTH domain
VVGMQTATVTTNDHPLRHHVAGEVRATLARKRLSAVKLAGQLGWSQTYMARRMSGVQPFDVDDLEAVAAALGMDPAVFLKGGASVTGQ